MSATAAPAATAQPGWLLTIQRSFATEGYKRLYVGNLSWSAQPQDLEQHFKQFGEVQVRVTHAKDHPTSPPVLIDG